jgi:hypothetical protein
MFLGWSSTKLLFFVPVGFSIWLPGPIICSDWLKFQRSSSLKPLGQLKPNCLGMIIGRSSTKIFEISANQSILLALAAILNIRLERKTITL